MGGFAQPYPDDMQSTKAVTAVDAGGIDTTLWEPQELGIEIYLCSSCINLSY